MRRGGEHDGRQLSLARSCDQMKSGVTAADKQLVRGGEDSGDCCGQNQVPENRRFV